MPKVKPSGPELNSRGSGQISPASAGTNGTIQVQPRDATFDDLLNKSIDIRNIKSILETALSDSRLKGSKGKKQSALIEYVQGWASDTMSTNSEGNDTQKQDTVVMENITNI